jgi:MFS superfamily sulfate permease-like transporter
MVALWGGWVGLGSMAGFGPAHLLPGIWNGATVNTAITLPVGAEVYGVFSVGAWLSERTPKWAKTFAKWSAWGSMILGTFGQVSYHILEVTHHLSAPWEITVLVSALPVITFAMATTLAHLIRSGDEETALVQVAETVPVGVLDTVPESVPETALEDQMPTVPGPATVTVAESTPTPVPAQRAPKRAPVAKAKSPEHVFSAELAEGRLPPIRAIKTRMSCGNDRARAILAELESLAQGVLVNA